jgi:A/G-specific adenine glycosylase
MNLQEFSQLLLDWYATHARQMPWRGNPDPYAVWVSEAMLQQTRVETVIPYFLKWMQIFPTIESLANADEQQVLNAWEGLGYYSRARSLRKAAQILKDQYHSQLPHTIEELLSLPGIGPYSAAAISSIAFGLDEAVLDGNVKRVLARVFNLTHPANSPAGEKDFWKVARTLLPRGSAGAYNQAVMDLGATICTPQNPQCSRCPINHYCLANKLGLQAQLPVMLEKKPIPHYTVCAAIIQRDGQVLIAHRPSNGLLGGMWEFPGGKVETGESYEQALSREINEELGTQIWVGELFGKYKHAYTHFRVTLNAFVCSLTGDEPKALEASEIRWVSIKELEQYPMGKIDRMISKDLVVNQKVK